MILSLQEILYNTDHQTLEIHFGTNKIYFLIKKTQFASNTTILMKNIL